MLENIPQIENSRDDFMRHSLRRRMIEIAISFATGRMDYIADKLRMNLANKDFNAGNYSAARNTFSRVSHKRLLSKANQMTDWIDFKLGHVERGWPRYPGADFRPELYMRNESSTQTSVFVKNPNLPEALINELGLKPWTHEAPKGKPLLVWFNFRSSLGGELLCAKIIKRFEKIHNIPMILAGDERLRDVLQSNFPTCSVIDKKDDLLALAKKCDFFLLARDALALTVQTQSDFIHIADTFLTLPENAHVAGRHRPNIAISWKTTNKAQGRYRNIPVEDLARLLSRYNIDIHSAQHGITHAERQYLESVLGTRIHFDTINTGASIGHLAARLAAMDAVVTIDNSVLHIGGAFDIPTIGLLSVPSYWAWPVESQNSWWHKNVTLIHQKMPRQWNDVLDRLGEHLDMFATSQSH